MAQSPVAGGMHKGLPTFRAGGSTSRNNLATSRDEDGVNHKSALKPSFFSHDHFSSSVAKSEDPMMKRTRVAVKVMEGKDLLVSDLPTGTSDPMAFVWVGSNGEGDVDLGKDQRIQATEVRKLTVDPVWDAEFLFPLEVQSVEDVMSGRVNILVRDFDDADGDVHYFDLGRASISLDTVLTEGNVMAHTQLVQLPARWYPLQRCRGMKKVRGALKIAVGFIVGSDSNLFLSDDAESGVEQSATDQATLFENKLRKIRRMRENTHGHAASLSPTQRGCASNRILTARGGTVGQRPKSAPAATHLTSPFHERQQPFELKPLEPKFQPSAEVQSATTPSDHRQNKYSNKQNPGAGGIAASIHDAKPRWRDVYGSTERRREIIPPPSASGMVGGTPVMAVPPSLLREKDPSLAKWDVDDPRVVKVRTSTKLSRINIRTASGAMKQQGRSEGAVVSASSGDEGLGVKAHRWYRQLLVTLDRLESSSTQSMAYGELRLIVREASATQVAQVVSASRGVGGSCSLSARRHMLKLLSWLCWDQPRAASKTYPGIITYALDRVRDADSASLRADLAACVSAVVLSALRNGTAQACMLQTQRFLDLVREQRAAVRESAGVCCAAAVLPRSPPVSLEVDTDMRSIEDLRLAIGQAAKHIGITSAVPKESVLLPGGLAVIELADAAAALAFYDAMTATSAGLPATWKIFPFPESSCDEAERAHIAHAARLTVNSEEILASLLEALDTSRSEGTRAPLLNAIAAMAHSCAKHGEQLSAIGVEEIATADECDGLSASLKKGLPAIVCAVLAILECSIRRAYTWRERAAALELVSSLSVLPALSGSQRSLGENRVRVIRGCVSAKHDSVAAVREAAGRALAALGATEVEESQERKGLTGSWARSRGTGVTIADLKRTYRAKQEEISKEESSKKKKTLGAPVNRAARENRDVDAEKCSVEKSEVAKDTLEKRVREKSTATKRRTYREHQGLKVDPDERAVLADVLNTPLSGAFSVEGGPEVPRAGGDDTRKGEIVLVQQEAAWPLPDDNRGAHEEQKKVRRPWEISSSPVKDQSSRDPPPEGEIKRETQETRPVTEKEQRIAYDTKASPLEPTAHAPNSPVQVLTIVPEPLQAAAPPSTTASRAENATPKPEGGPDSAASTGSGGGECIPVPGEGNIHVDTVRLLRHLNKKSDGISNILSRLDQRLLGLEKSLVECLPATSSPMRVSSRKLKRPRSGKVQPSDLKIQEARLYSPPGSSSPPPVAARSATQQGRLRWDIGRLVERGEIEGAFRLVLGSGTERDILRLMGSTGGPGKCRRRLGMETRDRLFAFLARIISSGQYIEHALPWVFEIVQHGEAKSLPLAVRMQLAGALHGLAASPTEQGVMAARLGPHFSLAVLGRASISSDSDQLLGVLMAGGGL